MIISVMLLLATDRALRPLMFHSPGSIYVFVLVKTQSETRRFTITATEKPAAVRLSLALIIYNSIL